MEGVAIGWVCARSTRAESSVDLPVGFVDAFVGSVGVGVGVAVGDGDVLVVSARSGTVGVAEGLSGEEVGLAGLGLDGVGLAGVGSGSATAGDGIATEAAVSRTAATNAVRPRARGARRGEAGRRCMRPANHSRTPVSDGHTRRVAPGWPCTSL
jgi:hypothetical protein